MPHAAYRAYFFSAMPPEDHTFLPKIGNYPDLLAYRKSEIIMG
jgi:hypothetical protein